MKTTLVLAAPVAALFFLGCPAETGTPERPADSLKATLKAAKSNDIEGFKAGISDDYIAVIEKYQLMAKDVPELRGAFEWKMFMNSLVLEDPIPQEEKVTGDKAVVVAAKQDGQSVAIKMVLEHGVWKIEVPGGMVQKLDHFDEVAKMAKGEKIDPRADIARGGGGKADRVKNLKPDATPAERERAVALDAFDLGDVAGAIKRLGPIAKENPNDEEVVVSLGRALVQNNDKDSALKVFDSYLAAHPDSHVAHHYAGMAYMFDNRPADAVASWKEVIKLDGAYAAQFKLDKRIATAEQMARAIKSGKAADPTGSIGAASSSKPMGGGH